MAKKKKTTATSKGGKSGPADTVQQPATSERAMDGQDQKEGKHENMGELKELPPQKREEGAEGGKKISSAEHEKVKEEEKKYIGMALEVWTDVLGFIKRIQLARTVSLTTFKIYEICEPRLHGNKVRAHEVDEIVIGSRCTQPPTALLIMGENREVPFPECPPLDYITGFRGFRICFIDEQVVRFFELLCRKINKNMVRFSFSIEMKDLEDKQRSYVNLLFRIFTNPKLSGIDMVSTTVASSFHLDNVDNTTRQTYMRIMEESDIPMLMMLLDTPRPDGQQRILQLSFYFEDEETTSKTIFAIDQTFRTSTQPQTFHITCYCYPHVVLADLDGIAINDLTDEILHITSEVDPDCLTVRIHRFPRGQEVKCAEEVKKRVETPRGRGKTVINVDISNA